MKVRGVLFTLLALLWVPAGTPLAHEVRPGYLELREIGEQSYDLLWKVPAKGNQRLGLDVRLPRHCRGSEPRSHFAGGAVVERWRASCAGGLTGGVIEIEGLSGTRTDVLARVERADGTSQTVRLTPAEPAFKVTAAAGAGEVIRTYFVLGVEAGQLLFIAAFFALVWAATRLLATRRFPTIRGSEPTTWNTAVSLASPGAYVIGTLASFWLIERTYGFWS